MELEYATVSHKRHNREQQDDGGRRADDREDGDKNPQEQLPAVSELMRLNWRYLYFFLGFHHCLLRALSRKAEYLIFA